MRKSALFIFIILLSAGVAYAQGVPVVNKIEIQGMKRIEEGAVKSKISQKIGLPISPESINEDIKTVYKMGYFDDVKAEIEPFEGGVKLIYTVREKPTIIKVDFQGNRELEDSSLKEKITITAGAISDTVLIQDNAAKLRNYYEEEGFWLVNIVPVIKKISDDDVSLTYQIDEGIKIKIKKIGFEGNNHISASKIKKVMDTSAWWLFSFVSSSGYYKKDRMESDIEKIRNLYFNEGYLKVIIAEPEINVDKEKRAMTITIKISEGDQYRISSVAVNGNKAIDGSRVRSNITLAANDIFRKSLLEKNLQAISSLYSENGYALVSVVPDVAPDEKGKTVRIIFNISEGDQYKVGRIEVSGNTKTRDKVIRREVRFDEGETFDSSKLKRTYERINNLNFFDSVEIVPKPKYEEKTVDLEIKVKEKPTGFFSVGGGYSSVDKFIATADLTQANLFGKGQYAKIKGEIGGRSSLYEISFKDPYFMDKPLSFSTGIYKTTRKYIEYNKNAFGVFLGLGKNFLEYWHGNVTYNFERATITNILDNASNLIHDQAGTKTTSSITPSISRDSRDNYLDPSRGSVNSLSLTYAGIAGSNYFAKGSLESGWYFPLGETTVMLRGRVGIARGLFDKKLPLYERFYVGGLYSIRGLDFGAAGPRDPSTGEAVGGTEELVFNTEFIFPIFPDMRLKGVLFCDAGNSYESFREFGSMRYTGGMGVRWISPMGPIRLEWGYNIRKKPGESPGKFEFAFGNVF